MFNIIVLKKSCVKLTYIQCNARKQAKSRNETKISPRTALMFAIRIFYIQSEWNFLSSIASLNNYLKELEHFIPISVQYSKGTIKILIVN